MSYICNHTGLGRIEHHPFGMLIEERSKLYQHYRFGFNGQEKDDEVSGSGNTLDFGARVYNPRIGTWHSIDPMWKQFPFSSAYVFGLNSPICFIDPDGRYIKPGNDASASKLKGVLIQVFGSEDVLNQFLVYSSPDVDRYGGTLVNGKKTAVYRVSAGIESYLPDPTNVTYRQAKKAVNKYSRKNNLRTTDGKKINGRELRNMVRYVQAAASNETFEVGIFNVDATVDESEFDQSVVGIGAKTKIAASTSPIIDMLQAFQSIESRNTNSEYESSLPESEENPRFTALDVERIRRLKSERLATTTGSNGVLVKSDGDGKDKSIIIDQANHPKTSLKNQIDQGIKDGTRK